MVRSLRQHIDLLKKEGLLTEIKEAVTKEDIPEILEALSGKGKAILFENVENYNVRVIANLVPSQKVFTLIFGGEEDPFSTFYKRSQGLIRRKSVERECTYHSFSLSEKDDLLNFLPILKHYEHDSAPYITTGIVSAIDPETNVIGRGIHRMEYRGKNKLGVCLLNPPLSLILEKYRSLNQKMAVSIAVGVDPLIFLAMALKVPEDVDKLDVAGALRGEPIETMMSFSYPIDVPLDTEIVIEGRVDPNEERKDGPLGEISGYYVSVDKTPTLYVEKISFKADPIYHVLLPRSREADMYLTIVSGAHLEAYLTKLFGFVEEIVFVEGTFGSSVIIRTSPTERSKINNLLHFVLSFPMIKKAVVVESDVNPYDLKDVEWAIITRCFADEDILLLKSMVAQPIDPQMKLKGSVTKIGINATTYGKNLERKVRVEERKSDRVLMILQKYLEGEK